MLIDQSALHSFIGYFILGLLVCGVVVLLLIYIRRVITAILDSAETLYASISKRPLFVHFYLFKRKLNIEQIRILENHFTFYNRLDAKYKRYFRHRVATFIKKKNFQGKEGFVITEEVKVLVSATAVMLTFGFRKYLIDYVKFILVYPTKYFSQINKTYHKGEYNAQLETLVLSWDNFQEGFRIEDDKLNLGIHEFAHAIHYSSIKQEDINSIIFVDTFNELREELAVNRHLKNELVSSNLIRSYALTNDAELLAVVIETFIEAPQAFLGLFPEVYGKLRQMLNFDFNGY
ncbi:zinc-dependent peptidase [Tamlana crocina]|uniref:Zinc-dependent peptidase n=1 Tax=Tamlana crocina TaxID=393006 RepID=A0ABX1DEN1_9FLAO|nr:zinc-dependent peptidase [Tamlana crocina]NJX16174.1 zinc-dependent peptidase [Tamlana crocina]